MLNKKVNKILLVYQYWKKDICWACTVHTNPGWAGGREERERTMAQVKGTSQEFRNKKEKIP